MTDKELIKKINNLQNFQPDAAWLKSNREVLFAQVNNSSVDYNPSRWEKFSMATANIFSTVYQPALVVAVIVLFLGGGVIFGHNILNVGPDNSLYIAKVISERARLNFVFDEAAKEKMAADFANDHAQTIANSLTANTNINSEELNKLNDSFKAEVASIKHAIKKSDDVTTVPAPAASHSSDTETLVSIANSGKSDGAVSVYSQTPAAPAVCSSSVVVTPDPTSILDEAEKLFESKDYSGALGKLKAANEVINK